MRSVKEWVGKTDDAAIPSSVKLRIVERQRERCVSCTRRFDSKLKPEFDHEVPLALGGKHREGNLRAICGECHGTKTKADASAIGRARRIKQKTLGIKKPKRKPGQSKWKKKVNGQVVLRNQEEDTSKSELEIELTEEVVRLKKVIKELKEVILSLSRPIS